MKVIKLQRHTRNEKVVYNIYVGQIRNEDDAGEKCNHEFLGNDDTRGESRWI